MTEEEKWPGFAKRGIPVLVPYDYDNDDDDGVPASYDGAVRKEEEEDDEGGGMERRGRSSSFLLPFHLPLHGR